MRTYVSCRLGETMAKIVITAETGCDIPAAEAAERGIELVPMHVSLGESVV